MKKVILVSILAISSISAFAQEKSFTAGLRLGVNLSQVSGNDLSLSSGGKVFNFSPNDTRAYGFVGGVFLRFGKTIFIQPEILLSQKGGKFNVFEDGKANGKTVDLKLTNLDLPILVGIKIGNVLRVNAGPVATFKLSDSGNLGDSIEEYQGQKASEIFNNVTLGYQAGVGFDIGMLNLDLRYEGNVNDVVNVKFTNPSTAAKFASKGNSLQATVGIHF
ncbi:porin family protein [Arcicella sp. LKC2W]|uniref:porin family protein n=1 Tax=Arcicella sp. LKC2W TaxID=2984198 RepID=UPI002B1F91F3|nr:porin family protein [Arcicella sp. LKC2W]MEA5461538.1 porin family protein [Arcicella sp. LKC2W]